MKVSVKTAKSNLNDFNFEYAHGTTSQFYKPVVAGIREVRKCSSFDIEVAAMRRVDPMPLPPMSLVRFNTRFFYVPMIDICPYFNELDNRTPYAYRYGDKSSDYSSVIPSTTPLINTRTIKNLFFYGPRVQTSAGAPNFAVGDRSNAFVELVYAGDTTTLAYDFCIPCKWRYHGGDSAHFDTYSYWRLTPLGRSFYKLLKGLGYDFAITGEDFYGDDNNSASQTYGNFHAVQEDEFSALPLLAFVKVYLNFYESAQYVNNTERLGSLNALLHIDRPNTYLTQNDLELVADLTQYVTYELDYFTTAFVNPANGNNFLENNESIAIFDPSFDDAHVHTDAVFGTSVYENSVGDPVVSQNGLNLLKRLDAYLRRHQIAGGRMVDRALVEYGVSIDSSWSRRSSFIDCITSVLNITPVLNTTSEELGDYAGFGSSSVDQDRNNVIHVECPEQDGFIIAIDTAIPEVMYSQGYKRHVRHMSKFDFVAGSTFDAVGTQAIELGELLMLKDGHYSYEDSESPTNLSFGFKPRGAEYKESYGYLTGDFICGSVNRDIDGYFTDRRFNPAHFLKEGSDHVVEMTASRAWASSYDSSQYKRIFYSSLVDTDYIKSIFRFKVHMRAPFRELYDEYKLTDLDGNNEVRMDVGGQQMQ